MNIESSKNGVKFINFKFNKKSIKHITSFERNEDVENLLSENKYKVRFSYNLVEKTKKVNYDLIYEGMNVATNTFNMDRKNS